MKVISAICMALPILLQAQLRTQGHANEHMHKNKFETLVERFESPERQNWQKPQEVIRFLGQLKNKVVLDLGAGTGYFSFRLAPLVKTVIAADVDERFLEFIRKKNEESQHFTNLILRKAEYAPLFKKMK